METKDKTPAARQKYLNDRLRRSWPRTVTRFASGSSRAGVAAAAATAALAAAATAGVGGARGVGCLSWALHAHVAPAHPPLLAQSTSGIGATTTRRTGLQFSLCGPRRCASARAGVGGGARGAAPSVPGADRARAAAALERLVAMRQREPATHLAGSAVATSVVSAEVPQGARVAHGATASVEVQGGATSLRGLTEQAFSRIYRDAEWGAEAQSGLGSREDATREFRPFLEDFLRSEGITSVVDAGCGHWPSGYQRFMNWQGVHYIGVDVVPYVVQENRKYFESTEVRQAHGLSSVEFEVGDATSLLPSADLLIVKDVLMHLPNAAIWEYLRNSVNAREPRYKVVMLVQNYVPMDLRSNIDIEPGQFLPFDITQPPFSAPFDTIFRWQSDEPKTVQVWRPR